MSFDRSACPMEYHAAHGSAGLSSAHCSENLEDLAGFFLDLGD